MNQVEQPQISHARRLLIWLFLLINVQENSSPFLDTFLNSTLAFKNFSLEFSRTSTWRVKYWRWIFFSSEHKSGRPHYYWESEIRRHVDILLANKECRLLRPLFGRSFKTLKGLNAGGFSHCPRPSLPPPPFSVPTPVQLSGGWDSYFANHKIKNTPNNRQLRRLHWRTQK